MIFLGEIWFLLEEVLSVRVLYFKKKTQLRLGLPAFLNLCMLLFLPYDNPMHQLYVF